MSLAVVAVVLAIAPDGYAQQAHFDRLPPSVFDVLPPPARVQGAPGAMAIRQTSCRNVPAAQVRRRIVELAVQEWAFFGFAIVDQTDVDDDEGFPRRSRRPGDAQSTRVAAPIAGYWTVAPGGDWIIGSQNKIWNGLDGVEARWRFPWSAAFVSWVMCEGGLRDSDQFQRAIAHHTYIDQAIRATRPKRVAGGIHRAQRRRSGRRSRRSPVHLAKTGLQQPRGPAPADGHRGANPLRYRRQGGPAAERILAIGGNVRGTVGLKILPAVSAGRALRSDDPVREARRFCPSEAARRTERR